MNEYDKKMYSKYYIYLYLRYICYDLVKSIILFLILLKMKSVKKIRQDCHDYYKSIMQKKGLRQPLKSE